MISLNLRVLVEMEGSVCLVSTRIASVGFSQFSLLLFLHFLWGQFDRLLTGETIQSNLNTVTSH